MPHQSSVLRDATSWGCRFTTCFPYPVLHLCIATVLFMGLLGGCATTDRDVAQFKPLPPARIGAADLDPVAPRSVTDLLRDAEQAFNEANVAQEEGDHEAALRHYTLMLELLLDADLDPQIFYSLRNEFGSILNTSVKQARAYAPHHPHVGAGGFTPSGEYSEIQVPFPLPERVLAEIESIQKAYPKNFQRALDRSYKYLPYIQAELKKEGLPAELAWVALIESHFTPRIVSRVGAGGMWQFMRATGRRYNLRQDHYVDERYNWHSATRAGISYLKDLNEYFEGDWGLAITAYNMGEGGLERAIAANGGERNLWKLFETPPASNRIRRETKKYYPKFLATLIVAANPERYGFSTNPEPAEDIVRVPVKGMYALDDLDAAMGYSSGTLAKLNPDLIREITPPSGEYAVAVPTEGRTKFLAALKKTSTLKYGSNTHKVRRGETVSQIAARYKVSSSELMRLNGIRSARRLQVGQTLRIPGYDNKGRGGAASSGITPATGGSYTVKRGDTLFEIALAHNVSVSKLQQWNGLKRGSHINVGQKLHVSDPARAASVRSAGVAQDTVYHTVRAGEYPGKIARIHGVALKDLLAWNGMHSRSMIRVGDRLVVKKEKAGSAKTASAPKGEAITHKITAGQSVSTIAAKYGVRTQDVLQWNSLTKDAVLQVGKTLTIYSAQKTAAQESETDAGAIEEKLAQAQSVSQEKIMHTVARGHNPTTIARRYGVRVSDLYRWNNWPRKHVLQVGEQVVIFKNSTS